jgi:polysaccharide export outer membrane protein
MYKWRLTSIIGLAMFSVFLWVFQVGCVTTQPDAVEQLMPSPATAAEPELEPPMQVSTENLSMAKNLKKRPVSEYMLGPEDSVEIAVFRHDELRLETTISPTGKLSYFFVRDVQAGGLTQFELRDKIQEELAAFIKDPEVVVRITDYRSHKVFVLGQVHQPGVFYMRNDYTLLEAISAAGGVTPEAYLGGAYLVRGDDVLLVNFPQLIEKGNMEENIPLWPSDVVYIPSDKDQKVFVLGEVNNQAAIPLGESLSLYEAIAEVGGFTHDANRESVLVLRGNLSNPQVMIINAKDMPLSANIPLQKGDVIYVDSSRFANVERTAIRISNILDPFLRVMRGVILTNTAYDVLRGEKVKTSINVN